MDNIKKGKDPMFSLYKFNTAGCACLIIFTFLIGIIPIILKINIISKFFPHMFIYLFLGAPSSTSNFLIAKLWKAPETSGGQFLEERKGITILLFFLSNLFFGFLCFFNYTRKLRANCVMGLAIFHLLYLVSKIIAILFPLICGSELNTSIDHQIVDLFSDKNINDGSQINNEQLEYRDVEINQETS